MSLWLTRTKTNEKRGCLLSDRELNVTFTSLGKILQIICGHTGYAYNVMLKQSLNSLMVLY